MRSKGGLPVRDRENVNENHRHITSEGGGCIHYHVHGPSHPYNAGTEHGGFSPTGQTFLAPSVQRREVCSASRMKRELHPTDKTACEANILSYR